MNKVILFKKIYINIIIIIIIIIIIHEQLSQEIERLAWVDRHLTDSGETWSGEERSPPEDTAEVPINLETNHRKKVQKQKLKIMITTEKKTLSVNKEAIERVSSKKYPKV